MKEIRKAKQVSYEITYVKSKKMTQMKLFANETHRLREKKKKKLMVTKGKGAWEG